MLLDFISLYCRFLSEFGIDHHFGSGRPSLFGLLGFGENKPSPYSDRVLGLYLANWGFNCITIPADESVNFAYVFLCIF